MKLSCLVFCFLADQIRVNILNGLFSKYATYITKKMYETFSNLMSYHYLY